MTGLVGHPVGTCITTPALCCTEGEKNANKTTEGKINETAIFDGESAGELKCEDFVYGPCTSVTLFFHFQN